MNEVLAALRDAEHVSVSSLKTYLMCPMKHAHRYLLRTEASHRSIALVLGVSVHEAVAEYYRFISEKGESPPPEFMTDALDTAWKGFEENGPPLKSDDLGRDKDLGIALVRTFREQATRPTKILAVEEPFAVSVVAPDTGEVQDRLLVGAIDAIVADEEGRVVLLELKTAKRRWSRDQLTYDLQPTVYQLAVRQLGLAEHPVLRYDFLLKLKKPCLESVEVTRSEGLEREAQVVITKVQRAVDAGIHYPVRSWACADCEFAHACG